MNGTTITFNQQQLIDINEILQEMEYVCQVITLAFIDLRPSEKRFEEEGRLYEYAKKDCDKEDGDEDYVIPRKSDIISRFANETYFLKYAEQMLLILNQGKIKQTLKVLQELCGINNPNDSLDATEYNLDNPGFYSRISQKDDFFLRSIGRDHLPLLYLLNHLREEIRFTKCDVSCLIEKFWHLYDGKKYEEDTMTSCVNTEFLNDFLGKINLIRQRLESLNESVEQLIEQKSSDLENLQFYHTRTIGELIY